MKVNKYSSRARFTLCLLCFVLCYSELLAAPQDATYLESESDSSPEQIGMHTMSRSLRESTSRHSAIPPPGMSGLGEAPKPPSLPRSSSFSSSNSSDSSIVSYSRSQSLFSHGRLKWELKPLSTNIFAKILVGMRDLFI